MCVNLPIIQWCLLVSAKPGQDRGSLWCFHLYHHTANRENEWPSHTIKFQVASGISVPCRSQTHSIFIPISSLSVQTYWISHRSACRRQRTEHDNLGPDFWSFRVLRRKKSRNRCSGMSSEKGWGCEASFRQWYSSQPEGVRVLSRERGLGWDTRAAEQPAKTGEGEQQGEWGSGCRQGQEKEKQRQRKESVVKGWTQGTVA